MVMFLEVAFLVLLRLRTCIRYSLLSVFIFFVLLGLLNVVEVCPSSSGCIRTLSPLSLPFFCLSPSLFCSSHVVVAPLFSGSCLYKDWHSIVVYVSSGISSLHFIESSTSLISTMYGAVASILMSCPFTSPRSGPSFCSDVNSVVCVLSSCGSYSSSACRTPPWHSCSLFCVSLYSSAS